MLGFKRGQYRDWFDSNDTMKNELLLVTKSFTPKKLLDLNAKNEGKLENLYKSQKTDLKTNPARS